MLAAGFLAGCAAVPSPLLCGPGQDAMTVAELLFGLKSRGRVIAESEWRRFLAREVTPRFPDGLTAVNAAGQWRDRERGTIVREPSKVVIIAFRDDAAARTKLEEIVQAYKQRFAQQSVGVLTRPVCASF
jgi:hypothetical protein